jgi:hypothetical protein
MFIIFIGWLIIFLIPNIFSVETSNQELNETLYNISGGTRDKYDPKLSTNKLSTSKLDKIKTVPQNSEINLKIKEFQPGGNGVKFKPGNSNPGGSGGNNDGYDLEIGTKNPICPNPDEIISNPDFWNRLQKDPEICLDEDDEDSCWDIESELTDEKPRRRLLAIQPVPAPVPTGKLDQKNLEKYDFTTKKVQPFKFWSREGILLSADHRSLRKIIYSHPGELGLTDLVNRIPCPGQSDPKKFQRLDCWAITDANIKEAVIKLFQFTTFQNSNIITAEMPMHECSSNRATYFIDKNIGVAMYFHKGGKQDGKLWSLTTFDPDGITAMLNKPNVYIITDFNYNPDLN